MKLPLSPLQVSLSQATETTPSEARPATGTSSGEVASVVSSSAVPWPGSSSAKPPWLRVKIPNGERYHFIRERARALSLHTVCEEARCPNIAECWEGGTATFMLMGSECTRGCRFCSVDTARRPPPLDDAEPGHVAETIAALNLDYVVLTTVNRDDLADQGSAHIARSIAHCRQRSPKLLIEVLIPDFQGDSQALATVLAAKPAVLAHNVETVERLTKRVRDPRAGYRQSLEVLAQAKRLAPSTPTKSSLMLGLGEREDEIRRTMTDLRAVGVDFLTIGQYLQPTPRKLPVQSYLPPQYFRAWAAEGDTMGFRYVAAGPLVRSSYRAAEFYIAQQLR